ncbi:MAG: hypothetical protein ACOC0A_00220 [Planctomycetota bacterium]
MEPKIIKMPVDLLEENPIVETNQREENPDLAPAIRNDGGKLPPVFTYLHDSGQRRVIVGTDVLQAAKEEGLDTVRAVIVSNEKPEALRAALIRAREVAADDVPEEMIIRRLAEKIDMSPEELAGVVEDVPDAATEQKSPEMQPSDEEPEPQESQSEPISPLEGDLQKHPLNIMPEMDEEDRGRVVHDMDQNGYDERQPIILFEGKILDGWNRYLICKQLGIEPKLEQFEGTRSDALRYVIRANMRRNLSSSQYAAIAVEADKIREQLETEARNRQGKRTDLEEDDQPCGKVSTMSDQKRESEGRKTREQLAERFNTNPRYVQDAMKLKEEVPDIFEQVKAGEKTISAAKKELNPQATETSASDDSDAKAEKPGFPQHIIDAVEQTLEEIDLAFCGDSKGEASFPADCVYTSGDDGLNRDWGGSVFMCPPVDKELPEWVQKVHDAYAEGTVNETLLLLPSYTNTTWFDDLHPFPRCYVQGNLELPGHTDSTDCAFMVVYLGDNLSRFVENWSDLGRVYPGACRLQGDVTPSPQPGAEDKNRATGDLPSRPAELQSGGQLFDA